MRLWRSGFALWTVKNGTQFRQTIENHTGTHRKNLCARNGPVRARLRREVRCNPRRRRMRMRMSGRNWKCRRLYQIGIPLRRGLLRTVGIFQMSLKREGRIKGCRGRHSVESYGKRLREGKWSCYDPRSANPDRQPPQARADICPQLMSPTPACWLRRRWLERSDCSRTLRREHTSNRKIRCLQREAEQRQWLKK
jgi:hypothetical protein